MKAYHGSEQLKKETIAMMKAHREADEFIRGAYWDEETGRGCSVGCLLKSGNHEEAEEKFGIPSNLMHLNDNIFESMSEQEFKDWPVRFVSAPEPGADLSKVHLRFLHWLLTDELPLATDNTKVLSIVKGVADLLPAFIAGNGDVDAMRAARAASYAAADAACAAYVADVAYAAADAACAAYVADVAYAVADAAARAAYAAYAVADAAARAAYAARAAAAAYCAAYDRMGDKLIELMESAQ